MRLLVQAILSSANHHGNECSVQSMEPRLVCDMLGIELDDERGEKIAKLFESLRHKLGDVAQESRQLLELLKYE